MNRNDLDDLLQQSLQDRPITVSEKKRLSSWLDLHADNENDRAFVRHRAFDLARELSDLSVIDWLEDVIKLTVKAHRQEPVGDPSFASDAFFSPGEDCLREIIRQLDLARQTCDICVFTVTDDRITNAIEKTNRRGVNVRIVTDNDKAMDAGSDIQRLIASGVPCVIDQTLAHMHHKFAIIDRQRLLSGSFNWTRSATMVNEENLIVTSDPGLVAAFHQRFEMLWTKLGGGS